MSTVRIALANIRVPASPQESVDLATSAIAEAGGLGAANTFHEKAILCRAAENTYYFASVNCASAGSGTTSAIARPDGTLQCFQPYGQAGLLVADLDLRFATGFIAARCRMAST